MQVDDLCGRITRHIQRIGATTVVDRQRRRPRVGGEVVDRSGRIVETIDRIAGARRRNAINGLSGIDVRHLRRDHIAIRTAVVILLGKIRHHRILPGIVGIGGVGGINGAAVVRALVAEAKRVAGLVDVGLVPVAVDSGLAIIGATVGGDPVGADVDGRGADYAGAAVTVGLVGGHRPVVGVGDIGRTGGLDEGKIGHLMPGVQRRLRQKPFGRRQRIDVVGDRGGAPMMGDGGVVLPEAVDEIIG